VPPSYGAQDYGAHGHRIPKGDDEVFAENFARAMSDMVSRYRRVTNPDSLQFCREVRATAICFAKRIAAHAGARASCSPLRVKGRAYSDTAGHKHQQQPCPNEDKAKTNRLRVNVIGENCDGNENRRSMVCTETTGVRDTRQVRSSGPATRRQANTLVNESRESLEEQGRTDMFVSEFHENSQRETRGDDVDCRSRDSPMLGESKRHLTGAVNAKRSRLSMELDKELTDASTCKQRGSTKSYSPYVVPKAPDKRACRINDRQSEHDDDVVCRRPVVPRRNVHRKNVHVEPTNTSTKIRGRGREGGNERRWTFVCKQQGILDAYASSSVPQNLSNNKVCCLQRNVVVQMNYAPISQRPTSSKARYNPSLLDNENRCPQNKKS
jgi:hypothetical protein